MRPSGRQRADTAHDVADRIVDYACDVAGADMSKEFGKFTDQLLARSAHKDKPMLFRINKRNYFINR